MQAWDLPNVSLFPKILGPKSFENSLGNAHIKFLLLDIMLRFN